jgi:hypothetical protein
MATDKERTTGEKNDDLRELLAMIAILVGSRVQRDVDGRDDVDVEADAPLAEIRDKLRTLLVRREEAAKPRALTWRSYSSLPRCTERFRTARSPSPHTPARTGRRTARESLTSSAPSTGRVRRRSANGCLSGDQIARPRNYKSPTHHSGGPVEAARAAVADVLGISARTLVHWERRDKVRPNDIVGPSGALLYGDTVHFPDAVADIVELLALDDESHAPVPERTYYVEALRAQDLPYGENRTWQDDIIDTDDDQ